MFNYDSIANTDDGSCLPIIFGCTDSTALNYDPMVNTDNGSCILPVYGCTDWDAYNYNIQANINDSSCVYDAGCITGPGNPYWLNDECYAWVISIDAYCCDIGWDSYCQSQYNYCAFGTPLDIEDLRDGQLYIYPNPTADIVNLIGLYKINVVVFDMKGNKILNLIDVNQIDFSNFENGIYNLSITYNNILINYRIIKI